MDTDDTPRIWAAKLLACVTKAEPSACWLWSGLRNPQGYGLIWWTKAVGRRTCTTAHRAALIIHAGWPIDPALEAMHTCDNPPCCNPLHLRWGTSRANHEDAARKGRLQSQRGIKRRFATRVRKLTDDDVRAIRVSPRRPDEIAAQFGCSALTVYNIKARRRKAGVPD